MERRRSRTPSVAAAGVLLLCLGMLLVVGALLPAAWAASADGCPAGGERASKEQGMRSGRRHHRKHGVKEELWVFGDSYADTGNLGNLGRELTHAWYDPYGKTFPRRPAGRFSDGRVLTDFVASALGMRTPVAYKARRRASREALARGMNFAVGGAGVLDTGNFQRNISAQIDLFQAMHHTQQRGCGKRTALVVVSGNDYAYAADKDNGTSAAIAYIPTVVRELRGQLRRLRDEAGMRRVVVTNLHPMGCTPTFTRLLNYTGCDPLANAGAAQHNTALRSVLAALDPNNRTFLLLDVHTPFAAFLLDDDNNGGTDNKRFKSMLRPCCESFRPDGYCGEEDENGTRQYALCDDPGRYFYWDDVHPTQAAWAAVARTFRAAVKSFPST
ncbi:GDSL esterase/lipase At5g03610-like [Triticum dicoccoides]|uniref:GDSL esterase/lipase At5g03610-like n=1 Tax=Triticum dicoccoides TaxID=85692 RepID=UPI00188FA438|nr:GDSL esterase/lipase At5g03610-like [Triticum dicoccoides]